MMVARTRPDPIPANRYPREKIGYEIKSCIEATRTRGYHTRVAEYLGMSSQQLTHWLAGDNNNLDVELVGAIADFMDAPPGWPFVPWQIAAGAFGHHKRTPSAS